MMYDVVICKNRSCFYEGSKAHSGCRCIDRAKIERLMADRDEARAECERLRCALKEYADKNNWGYYDDSGCAKGMGAYEEACFIGPGIARAALEGRKQ